MPKIFFKPIGQEFLADADVAENLEKMGKLDFELFNKRKKLREGWGETYQKRVKAKGKMTAYERVESLADDTQHILYINSFVNDGESFGDKGQEKTCPNAGVLTCLAKVAKRWVVIIANENTVASGSWWPKTPEKIIRAQEIALKLKLPVIYLVDCSGLFLPEQGRTFPGARGAGHIFKMNSLLSDSGVPQIAGVCGDCIAGGGYMPIISDRVYMTEQAYMVIAGAALIRGAKSLHLSSHDIGGAHIHVHQSNCADIRVPNDEIMLKKIRADIALLPSSAVPYYQGNFPKSPPRFSNKELSSLLPVNHKKTYDIKQILARLVDDSLFSEFEPEKGQEVLCGIAKIAGLNLGFMANVQALFPHPKKQQEMRAGGILYEEGVKKLSRFVRALNDDGLPMVWLQDVSGFDVGLEAEKTGLLAYGSSLIYANSTHKTPMMTAILRKASGAGYYAMAGLPYDPVLQVATPQARLAVMEGQTLAVGAFNSKLDDDFKIATKDLKERAAIEQGMAQVRERIEQDMNPYKAASQMDVDEIISITELRKYLEFFAEASYQNIGVRRVKNPRIWSLYDLID